MFKRLLFILPFILNLNSFSFGQVEQIGSCYHLKKGKKPIPTKLNEENLRSDSIDISKYTINLDKLDFSNQTITGNCIIDFSPKLENIGNLNLDLLNLTVDSIVSTIALDYSYNGLLLSINLNTPIEVGTNYSITVYYHGNPTVDGSGFGGFDFQGGVAYNLGIAFYDLPHNYGRSWFPCFDNFIERSTFEFNILTTGNNKAFATGYLVSETLLGGDTVISKWKIDEEIPTYLAGIAVSNYEKVIDTYSNISGTQTPVLLVAKAADTTDMKNSFIHLQDAFNGFENYFGYYRWNKLGYALTPVGAMEHPTLVAYPDFLANGNLSGERVMAHELAHHWFGNLITCRTPEDMWINEGHAEYLSYVFVELVDGAAQYKKTVRDNHKNMLHTAHLTDDGYLTLNNIPLDKTYGTHVYNKGADLVHTLRGYLGDSLFFNSLKLLCDEFEFRDLSTLDYMEYLNTLPNVNVSDYFNDWIFQPGWCQFSIDSFSVEPLGDEYSIDIFTKQKLKAADHFYNNVPLNVLVRNENGLEYTAQILMSEEFGSYNFISPVFPAYIGLNHDEKISTATTGETLLLSETGSNNVAHADFILDVTEIQDPVYLRIEENWVAADAAINETIIVSPDRYWRVDGIINSSFKSSGKIYYDSRNNNTGNIDVILDELIEANGVNEDSLKLFFRPNRAVDWYEFPYYTLDEIGSNTNGYSSIEIDSLWLGDYAIGIKNYAVGLNEVKKEKTTITVKPNPANNQITIENFNLQQISNTTISIYAESGSLVFTKNTNLKRLDIDVSNWISGAYFIKLNTDSEKLKFVIE
jgi:Peptidase family M1 domain/Secretion system C-terminal sorting domain/Peptidase M1 N-terminal domain